MDEPEDFIRSYINYTTETECPTFFHRWTAVACLGAYLGRRPFFHFGHFTLHPNIYCMLIGSPGTKKSSAIKIGAKLLKQAGYKTFAAKKTRQEKFLLDLAEQGEVDGHLNGVDILDANLWGDSEQDDCAGKSPAECFIAADEFNNFIGSGNMDFISILGELWDHEGVFDYKLKNSKSVYIPDPTISILGGNTPTGFAHAFPVESLGQGFFSRLLLVYGEPTGIKYTFPPPPDMAQQEYLIGLLHKIKNEIVGESTMTPEGKELIHEIYQTWGDLDDTRFEHYSNRRLTHLLKLCMVCAASRVSRVIDTVDIIEANTLLSYTEHLMPKALGEFGKAKNSGVTHKVMGAIQAARAPMSFQAIWKLVHQDLDARGQLVDIINNLQIAEKIQSVTGGGYLPIRAVAAEAPVGTDWGILTKEERDLL